MEERAALYDAGDKGCGDGLAAELRRRIGEIGVGQILEVIVREPSARTDAPAMLRMLGHEIVTEEESGRTLRMLVRRTR